MLYTILKPVVRVAMWIFCRRIIINKPKLLNNQGPLLLACNHPNSFLDAAILATLFKRPVYSLARGDVFQKAAHRRLLTSLKILPIYRTSEGAENLEINYQTFAACKKIFKNRGTVLIFSEAGSINEWHLRPLRKGTARLAFSSWAEQIPLEVLPVGINYSSFRRFSKNVFINFGRPMRPGDFKIPGAMENADNAAGQGRKYQAFTRRLKEELHSLVFEIHKHDRHKQEQLLEIRPSTMAKIFLFAPALIGFAVHAPLYLPLKSFTYRRTRNNDHYDAVLMALLVLLYPLYLAVTVAAVIVLTHNLYFLLLAAALPFTAWAYAKLKPQLDEV